MCSRTRRCGEYSAGAQQKRSGARPPSATSPYYRQHQHVATSTGRDSMFLFLFFYILKKYLKDIYKDNVFLIEVGFNIVTKQNVCLRRRSYVIVIFIISAIIEHYYNNYRITHFEKISITYIMKLISLVT